MSLVDDNKVPACTPQWEKVRGQFRRRRWFHSLTLERLEDRQLLTLAPFGVLFQPGDADLDFDFDHFDLIPVLGADKYASGERARWQQGAWNGDGVFDHLDDVASVLAADAAIGFSPQYGALAEEQGEVPPFPKSGLFTVAASGKTGSAGTADDPAIWVHPTDPALSVVIGTNKNTSGGLHVFNLNGKELQFMQGGKHNNVDLRYGFMLGGQAVDLVSTDDRNNNQIDIYKIDPNTRQLIPVGVIQAGIDVYGYAMYHSRDTGKFYGIVASGDGVEQWEFVDQGNGKVGGVRVRAFGGGNTIEGIVADDESGYLYLAEENHGIFKYRADPDHPDGNTRLATVDVVGSATRLVADVEGLTIYYRRNGLGYLIASSQGNDRFVVYRREGNNEYLGTFEVDGGVFGDANDTDGIDVINMALGPLYPQGMFVAQSRDIDYKMVGWEDIANALGLAIDTQGYDVRGGGCNAVASVEVSPAGATVEVGATVQLSAIPKDGDGTSLTTCEVTWSTSDENVATVDPNGLVTGADVGGANIKAASQGVSGTAAITVVLSTNTAPVVDAGADLATNEGSTVNLSATFTDDAGDTHTASINWGDGSIQPGTVSGGTVTGSHVYANDGLYTVTVTVNDNRGGVGLDSATVTVSNVVPTASAGGPYSGFKGSPMTFSGSATDPGADPLTFEWDFDYQGGTFDVDASGPTVQHTYALEASYTVALRVWDDDGVSSVATTTATVTDKPPVVLYFALSDSANLSGMTVQNEDIVAFDGTNFSLYFDGSDVGLSSFALDSFAVISPTEILMSFTSSGTIGAVSMDDSDIVMFTATSLGENTAGTFSMYFDASDVGLTTSDEDVDAIELLSDGRLLVSTTGSFSVPGPSGTTLSGADEDLIVFTPTSLGPTTAGTWAMYFDGSDVGLTNSSEDVDAVAVDGSGTIYLSTTGSFSVTGLSGADEDVFVFMPSSLGSTTAGTFGPGLFFDGSLYRLGSTDMVAMDLP